MNLSVPAASASVMEPVPTPKAAVLSPAPAAPPAKADTVTISPQAHQAVKGDPDGDGH